MDRSNDWIWWLVIIILLCSVTPVGLILLLVYLNRNKGQKQIPEKTGQTAPQSDVRTAVNQAMHSAGAAVDEAMRVATDAINNALNNNTQQTAKKTRQTGRAGQQWTSAHVEPRYEPARKPHKPRRPLSRAGAKAKMIVGAILTGVFTLGTVSSFFEELSEMSRGSETLFDMLGEVVPLSIFACLCGILALWGYFGMEKARRFERYQNLIQPERAALSVHALADALQLRYNRVCDDLQEMIDRGYFAFAYLDRSQGRLVLSPDYVDMRPAEQPAPQPQNTEQERAEDNEMLRRIRAANDAIANPEMSASIDEIEDLTRKMFRLVEERPEKAGSLRSFSDYYLPQAMKICEAYARMEAQGVEGENITQAKEKITAALRMIAASCRQQLDQLFADDVVDITADIAVMEQMLARDGLTGDELQPERRK